MHAVETTPLIIVAGPTASGKSALALALAATLGGTIVNADSMQVYHDLPILTAQPDAAARKRAPHRLYGEVDAAERFSAGAWRRRAVAEIVASRDAGRVPILTGGTGLYFRVLLEGLAPTPPIPAAIRAEARALRAAIGAAAFHDRLRQLDPEGAARLAPGDSQRTLRAYEVAVATGRTLGDWQREANPGPAIEASAVIVLPPRETLYAAGDQRFLGMMARGAEEEVRTLLGRGLDPTLPAMRALGVPELASWVRGEIGRDTAVAAAQQATRNYAKRQIAWFRHQLPDRGGLRKLVLEEQFSESPLVKILPFIRR